MPVSDEDEGEVRRGEQLAMRDQPGDVTVTVVCPACDSGDIGTLPAAGADENPEYRCYNCATEFDAGGGGESPLADSDAPHAP